MIYWDASALVKKYFREDGSGAVLDRLKGDPVAATSALSYAEIHAVFARKRRERGAAPGALQRRAQSFDGDWESLIVVRIGDALLPMVRDVLGRHPLRGADAVHLASALFLARQTRTPALCFACADERLLEAAAAEGLGAWNPARP